MISTAMRVDRRLMTSIIVPLSLDGTPAAGSSSSRTLGDDASDTAISISL
jgi:hypothetical protein